MTEKKVQVEIDGLSYTLITDESEDKIQEMSKYVERKIKEVKSQKLPNDKQLVLTGLYIADDLYNVGNKYSKLREESKEAVEKYPGLVENYRLAVEQNDELLHRIEEMSDKNVKLESEVAELNNKVKANDQSEKTIERLRTEVARLQKEAARLKSENNSLKEKIWW